VVTEIPAPNIVVIPGKEDVQSEVTLQDSLTIIDISSESGIGNAEIRYPAQPQPETIVLRMHLGGLENLQIKGRESTIQASVSSIQPYLVRQSLITQGEESPIDRSSPYWLDITIVGSDPEESGSIPLRDGYFEVGLPAEVLRSENDTSEEPISNSDFESLVVSWIDFYR
jgi:hypothetical protein